MRPSVVVVFGITIAFAVWFPMHVELADVEEDLQIANLIIVSTEHQRNEAQKQVRMLEQVILEQEEQCRQQPPRLFRGPYYPEQKPQQNQEDAPPVSC